jgi:predicted permease
MKMPYRSKTAGVATVNRLLVDRGLLFWSGEKLPATSWSSLRKHFRACATREDEMNIWRLWSRRQAREADLERELRDHVDLEAEEQQEARGSAEEAAYAAQRALGNTTQIKEDVRMAWGFQWFETLIHDLRYGLRQLRRSPGFTTVAVLTLALGIGANSAIFSFIDVVILRMLPVRHPQALVLFGPGDQSGNSDNFPDSEMHLFSYSIYREMRQNNRVFSGVAAFGSSEGGLHGTVGASGNLEPMEVELVSGTYFNVLGVNPIVGRVFTDADDQTLDGHPVAVISYGWWDSRFSRDPSIVGETLTLEGIVYTIIGVTPPGFFGTTVGRSPDLWIPLQMNDALTRGPHKLNDKMYRFLDIIARLKPGVSRAQAAANVNLVLKNILHGYAGSKPSQDRLQDIRKAHITLHSAATGNSFLRQDFSKPLWLLMAIVGSVLLIACANVANLLLARGAARRRETGLRLALGAGRVRLIRQLLTENILLAGAGGALGILFAWSACRFLLTVISPTQRVLALDVSPDARVLAFTVLVSLGCALLFGILPALRSTRLDLTPSFKEEGRGAMSGQARSPFGKALIISQVALSLVLLAGAGLFIRSLMNLANVDTGFNGHGALLFRVDPSATGFTQESSLANMYRQIEERVDALPGVGASSFSIFAFHDGSWDDSVWAEGYRAAPGSQHEASFNAVGPGYFAAMGLPILAGRDFGRQDTAASQKVAVINETMARRFFPSGSPIGKRFGGDPEHSNDIEVVGVVRDAKYYSLDETPEAFAYYPYTQYMPGWGIGLYLRDFEVRYSGNRQMIVPAVRRAMGEINQKLPIANIRSVASQVDASITFPRLIAELSSFFGIVAVFLACIGIYGLTSYAVSRRTHEIGIRMALGAQKADVLRMVMRETVALAMAGLGLGIPIAFASGRWVASALYGLKSDDPATLLVAVVLLLSVAVFAGFLPARRAAKVDPMTALRQE